MQKPQNIIKRDILIKKVSEKKTQKQIAKDLQCSVFKVKKSLWFHKILTKRPTKQKRQDIIGKKFGLLTITEVEEGFNTRKVLCLCDCGNKKKTTYSSLSSKNTISCGCITGKRNKGKFKSNKAKTNIGKRFGKLKIIQIEHQLKNGAGDGYKMVCKCDCGNITKCRLFDLKWKKIISCGCFHRQVCSKMGSKIGIKNYKNKHNWYFINQNNEKIKCRSSFEVFFANYLSLNQISFEYEPKIFKLKNNIRYIPDFYLIDNDTFIELKGQFTEKSKTKITLFKKIKNIKILFWKDIISYCNLPYRSLNTYFIRAKKKDIHINDYLASGAYLND